MWNKPKLLKTITKFFILFQVIFYASFTQAQNFSCSSTGYAIGFFNGVWNTKKQAFAGRDALAILIGNNYKNESVGVELFYNTSGTNADARWATGWQDLAEVFDQRSTELDGILANRWEFFWEALGGNRSLWDNLIDSISGTASLFTALTNAFTGKALSLLTGLASSPPTTADYAVHETRIKQLAAEGKKLLFVAHSQGNLFVNKAYDKAEGLVTKSSVQVVHIAPASIDLKGNYTLADIDVIINGLRVTPGTVPSNNVFIPKNLSADWSGHTLIETYLDPNRAARGMIHTNMTAAMEQLVTPVAAVAPARNLLIKMNPYLAPAGAANLIFSVQFPDNTISYYYPTAAESRDGNIIIKVPEFYSNCEASIEGTYKVFLHGSSNTRPGGGYVAQFMIARENTLPWGSLDVVARTEVPIPGGKVNINAQSVIDFTIEKGIDNKYLIKAR